MFGEFLAAGAISIINKPWMHKPLSCDSLDDCTHIMPCNLDGLGVPEMRHSGICYRPCYTKRADDLRERT